MDPAKHLVYLGCLVAISQQIAEQTRGADEKLARATQLKQLYVAAFAGLPMIEQTIREDKQEIAARRQEIAILFGQSADDADERRLRAALEPLQMHRVSGPHNFLMPFEISNRSITERRPKKPMAATIRAPTVDVDAEHRPLSLQNTRSTSSSACDTLAPKATKRLMELRPPFSNGTTAPLKPAPINDIPEHLVSPFSYLERCSIICQNDTHQWVEIRCSVYGTNCGNSNGKRSYLKGRDGMQRHLSARCAQWKSRSAALDMCTYRIVPIDQVKRIATGQTAVAKILGKQNEDKSKQGDEDFKAGELSRKVVSRKPFALSKKAFLPTDDVPSVAGRKRTYANLIETENQIQDIFDKDISAESVHFSISQSLANNVYKRPRISSGRSLQMSTTRKVPWYRGEAYTAMMVNSRSGSSSSTTTTTTHARSPKCGLYRPEARILIAQDEQHRVPCVQAIGAMVRNRTREDDRKMLQTLKKHIFWSKEAEQN